MTLTKYKYKILHCFSKNYNIIIFKLILKSPSRNHFESQMLIDYAPQVELAMKYAEKVFGKDFPPY